MLDTIISSAMDKVLEERAGEIAAARALLVAAIDTDFDYDSEPFEVLASCLEVANPPLFIGEDGICFFIDPAIYAQQDRLLMYFGMLYMSVDAMLDETNEHLGDSCIECFVEGTIFSLAQVADADPLVHFGLLSKMPMLVSLRSDLVLYGTPSLPLKLQFAPDPGSEGDDGHDDHDDCDEVYEEHEEYEEYSF